MTEDRLARDNLNNSLMEKGFGDYSHDRECMELANQLEIVENELSNSLAINEVQKTESITSYLLEIKLIRTKLGSCSSNLLIIGYGIIADYQEFKINPSPN